MAAARGRHLVLDHGAGEAGLGVAADGALDVERVAVAGVGVADHRDRHRIADVTPLLDHLGVGDQPGIRQAEPRGGDRESAHEADAEAGPLDHAGGQRVVAGRGDQQARLGDQRAQAKITVPAAQDFD